MAEINTVIAEASQDLQIIEDFVNLPAGSDVRPRLLPSVNVGTLAGIRDAIFEAGGLPATPFATKALMTASALADGKYAQVTDGGIDNGLYVKTAGVWVKSAYDVGAMGASYIESTLYKDTEVIAQTFLPNMYVDEGDGNMYEGGSDAYRSYYFAVSSNKEYKLTVNENATAFRVAFFDSEPVNQVPSDSLSYMVVDIDSTRQAEVFSGDANWAVVYLGGSTAVGAAVTVEPVGYELNKPILASGLTSPLKGQYIEKDSITPSHTTFVKNNKTNAEITLRRDILIGYVQGEPAYLYAVSNNTGWSYEFAVGQSDFVEIALPSLGRNRFRVVGVGVDEIKADTPVLKEINLDDSASFVSFQNDGSVKKILVQINTASSAVITVKPNVVLSSISIQGLRIPDVPDAISYGYRATFSKIPNTQKGTLGKVEYPRLAAVKYEYREKSFPQPVGYLYSTRESQEFLYSHSTPDNMQNLCSWNSSITWNGSKKITDYNQFITDDGDIVCVARGDLISGNEIHPDARQNPIIYPAGDYSNPIVVEFGERTKPTNWLLSTGITQVPNQDCFMFSEYTRPTHASTHIWRVTKPYTNPDNWQIVAEFEVDRPNSGVGHKEGNLKHMHTLNWDPWSNMLVSSTGDYSDGAKILSSKDNGLTWQIEAENDESRCRVLNISFDEEGAWWGSDSHGAKHVFIHCPRGEDGYVDLSFANMQLIDNFTNSDSTAATYATVRLTNPNGFLFLDRQDNVTTTAAMSLNFYSLDDRKMYEVAKIAKFDVKDWLGGESVGFRSDAVTLYQAPDGRIVVGFHDTVGRNSNDVAGNEVYKRLDNTTIYLEPYFG